MAGRVEASLALLVNPEKEVSLTITHPHSTGRNFNELLRAYDSMRITYHVPALATWANWQPGGQEGTLIQPRFLEDGRILSDEECDEMFPKGFFECLYPWFRITPIPDLPFDTPTASSGGEDDGNGDDQEEAASRPGTAAAASLLTA